MQRSSCDINSLAYFHDLSKVHYGYSVAHMTNDGHVVRDEDVAHLIFILNGSEKVQNLSLC